MTRPTARPCISAVVAFLFLFAHLAAGTSHAETKKVALLIGISDYSGTGPPDHRWDDLNTEYDLEVMQAALERQNFDRTHQLADGGATHAGILEAFEAHLVSIAAPGDVAFFHYSGHGVRLTDDNHDELDGYDESLVPSDAPADKPGGLSSAESARYLRDDDIGAMFTRLRKKLGPEGEFFVSIDSCHSGQATRGGGKARGSTTPIGPPQQGASGSDDLASGFNDGQDAGDLAPLVFFAAARHNQLSIETEVALPEGEIREVGSLSLALGTALANAGKNTSYSGLFSEAKAAMAGYGVDNIPQAEGQLDHLLFAGEAVDQQVFFEGLKPTSDQVAEDQAPLAGGFLTGLSMGSRVAFYRPNTRGPKEPGAELLAGGEIVEISPSQAVVQLDEGEAGPNELVATWGFVTHKAQSPMQIALRIDTPDAAWVADVEAAVADSELLSFSQDRPTLMLRGEGAEVLIERFSNGAELDRLNSQQRFRVKLKNRLEEIAKYLFLQQMDLESDNHAVKFRVIPCHRPCGDAERCECTPTEEFTSAGNIAVPEGSFYQIEVTNMLPRQANQAEEQGSFISILELMPNGTVAVIWPRDRQPAQSILAGTTQVIDNVWKVGPPFGNNVLKLFASETAIDFRRVFQTTRGAPQGALEMLFKETITAGTRGSESVVPADTGVSSSDRAFEIVRRQ